MIRIAIVGSQGKYWTPEERTKVIITIHEIFRHHGREICKDKDTVVTVNPYKFMTLVSGGCGCDGEKILFDGGVDMWAEIVADIFGIQKDIKYSDAQSWEDREGKKGYKTRNLEIIRDCDVLYCIDPMWREWSGGRWTFVQAGKRGKEVYLELIE